MEPLSDTKMESSPTALENMMMFIRRMQSEEKQAELNVEEELSDFDYEPKEDEVLYSEQKQYIVQKIVGRGAFGTVVKCWDTSKDDPTSVAIKVITPSDTYAGGIAEAEILLGIKMFEGATEYLITMVDIFFCSGRLCIALETMEMSLYHYYMRKAIRRQYLDMSEIRRILHDILMGLVRLKEIGLIHADIKPQNIMLRGCGSIRTLRAKLIDFGLTHHVTQKDDEPFLQTLPYRSPEVIMHSLPYTEAIDVWSVGCVVGELLTKKKLYPGRCEFDQLKYITKHRCQFPTMKMLKKGLRSPLFFHRTKKSDPFALKSSRHFLETVQHDGHQQIEKKDVMYERQLVPSFDDMVLESTPKNMNGDDLLAETADRRELRSLMEVMLKVDPNQRISPERALRHSFFRLGHLQPYIATCSRVRESFESMGIPVELKKQRRSSHNSSKAKKTRSPAA